MLYKENAPISKLLQGILTLLAVLLLLALYVVYTRAPAGILHIFSAIVLLVLLAFFSFLTMRFEISDAHVSATFFPFTYCVNLADITNVSKASVPWYVGWGLRFDTGAIYFLSRHNGCVAIGKKRGFFKNLVLSVRDADGFIKRLNAARKLEGRTAKRAKRR